METITGCVIPEDVKGVVYMCKYNYDTYDLKVINTIFFNNPVDAINAYANIPNPESQIAYEIKDRSLKDELLALHKKMNDLDWRKNLANYL